MNVLFVCRENAGRSQLAEHLFNASARGLHEARSAGSTPRSSVYPEVIEALRLRGVDATGAKTKPLSQELTDWADRVVTMGCGDECPVTGKPTEDWELPDVAGKSQDEVEDIAVQVAKALSKLLKELQVPAWA
ncbi:MAG: low molecular weight phosphatase family protein [Actinomycetota bacterium]